MTTGPPICAGHRDPAQQASTTPSSPTPAPAARAAAYSTRSRPHPLHRPGHAGVRARRRTRLHRHHRRRLRAFVELHRPSAGTEQAAEQLAACARPWQHPGPDGTGQAREQRWRTFPTLLIVLTGTAATDLDAAVEDLLLAAEENPTTAELLAAVPAGAARLEDLALHGPAAPVWHPLGSERRAPIGWTELQA
ncbi:hypothetical protein ACIA8O_37270 [Kitasatospora sp. NPDC051853]|uniref:hypothetical protein n=1 Tax=Kitasatospora sp. NPDC051853 TaxID=3364058 RepID=UPI0037B57E6A